MNRIISYGIEAETGIVVSRVDGVIAYPVLDFAAIGQGGDGYAPGDFRGPTRYDLEKFSVYYPGLYASIRWTKGRGTRRSPLIPVELKNRHRAFWGFRPLPESRPS